MDRSEKVDLLNKLKQGEIGVEELNKRRIGPVLIQEGEDVFRCTNSNEVFSKEDIENEDDGKVRFILPHNNRD